MKINSPLLYCLLFSVFFANTILTMEVFEKVAIPSYEISRALADAVYADNLRAVEELLVSHDIENISEIRTPYECTNLLETAFNKNNLNMFALLFSYWPKDEDNVLEYTDILEMIEKSDRQHRLTFLNFFAACGLLKNIDPSEKEKNIKLHNEITKTRSDLINSLNKKEADIHIAVNLKYLVNLVNTEPQDGLKHPQNELKENYFIACNPDLLLRAIYAKHKNATQLYLQMLVSYKNLLNKLRDIHENTLLLYAVKLEFFDLIPELIKLGLNVNARDKQGKTSLEIMLSRVQEALQNGLNKSLSDKSKEVAGTLWNHGLKAGLSDFANKFLSNEERLNNYRSLIKILKENNAELPEDRTLLKIYKEITGKTPKLDLLVD